MKPIGTPLRKMVFDPWLGARIPLLFEDGGFPRVEVVQKKRKEIRLAA